MSLVVPAAFGATTVNHVLERDTLSLDGKWNYIVDPYDSGYYDMRSKAYDEQAKPTGGYFQDRRNVPSTDLVEYDFDKSPTLVVPHDWNTQDPKLFYYEGSVWYRRLFECEAKPGTRVFLHFSAANYAADVYLNGMKLGRHVGGYTPFDFEVTDKVRAHENSLVVRCDNRRVAEGVPTLNTDWWNYGGLTRDVELVFVPKSFISDASAQLDPKDPSMIKGFVQLAGTELGSPVTVSIPELSLSASLTPDKDGRAAFRIPAGASLERWAPGHPRLYKVRFETASDHVEERIGFRTIEVKGHEILLNGKPVFLRGVCVHEENPLKGGRASTIEDARVLMGWARDLNCNFLRLAHYPHSEFMSRLADEMGILLWEEIPVYWSIHWTDPGTLANAENQLSEVINRDRDRASVIVWSVSNETPVNPERTQFLRTLVEKARSEDGTRLVSAAMEVRHSDTDPNTRIVDDPFGAYTDLLSFNEYIGWYDGNLDRIPKTVWQLHYDKPVVISEFGADALQGLHGPVTQRFTEEYQAELYRRTLAMLTGIPQLRGMTPWIIADFRSPKRNLPQVQDGWNRKGLVGENGIRKEAFGVLHDFYVEKMKEAGP